ncbi:MAG: IclR family transcriptional regulator [Gaiellales bacterium]
MPPTGRPAERRLAAVERALRILDAFTRVPGDVGTTELARLSGVNASTVSRTLSTMVDAGYVVHVPATGRYRLGPHVLALANHALSTIDLRGLARPHLVALEQATGETATLSVPGDPDAVTVDFVTSRSSVASVARVGRPSVAHATATGKVMLAFAQTVPAEPLERFTELTITDPGELAREVEAVRAQGWARAAGEREPDLAAVAAPVAGARGELVAILGVQGPVGRFGRAAQDAAVVPLVEHARGLSAELGAATMGDMEMPLPPGK